MSRVPRDSLIGMRHISDALGSATHDAAKEGDPNYHNLRTHPGKGKTVFEIGLPRLETHAADLGLGADGVAYVAKQAWEQYQRALPMLESPIERTMMGAMITGRWAGFETLPARVHDSRRGSTEHLPVGDLVIAPQLAIFKYRLDFGLVIEKAGHRHIVAVECDGAEFHGDASKDRTRDNYLASWDIPTFRLKGSEIHEDAISYADDLIGRICHWKAS